MSENKKRYYELINRYDEHKDKIKACDDYISELEKENEQLKEMIYAMAEADNVHVLKSAAKLFKKWIEKNPEDGY